jgi:hypothetical protein
LTCHADGNGLIGNPLGECTARLFQRPAEDTLYIPEENSMDLVVPET